MQQQFTVLIGMYYSLTCFSDFTPFSISIAIKSMRSGGNTLKSVSGVSGQFKFGGGDLMHTSG
jgi:hypothetical protein